MTTSLERSLGALFAPRKPSRRKEAPAPDPVIEYHVHDDGDHTCNPAYWGTDKAEAERIAATLIDPEIVEVKR